MPLNEAAALLAAEVESGECVLKSWDDAVEQWITRVNLLAGWFPEWELPRIDAEDRRLLIEQICHGAISYSEIKERPVWPVVKSWLSPAQQRLVDEYAPERMEMPNGRKFKIVYSPTAAPVIAARIQDLYGVEQELRIAHGRIPLVIQVLAPNQRPIQITQNLANFWKESYPVIKKELQRKYPRHEWQIEAHLLEISRLRHRAGVNCYSRSSPRFLMCRFILGSVVFCLLLCCGVAEEKGASPTPPAPPGASDGTADFVQEREKAQRAFWVQRMEDEKKWLAQTVALSPEQVAALARLADEAVKKAMAEWAGGRRAVGGGLSPGQGSAGSASAGRDDGGLEHRGGEPRLGPVPRARGAAGVARGPRGSAHAGADGGLEKTSAGSCRRLAKAFPEAGERGAGRLSRVRRGRAGEGAHRPRQHLRAPRRAGEKARGAGAAAGQSADGRMAHRGGALPGRPAPG